MFEHSFNASLYYGAGKMAGDIYRRLWYPILGKGTYYAFSRREAGMFGKVTEEDVSLKKALVIHGDKDWRKLTKEAGWKNPNPLSVSNTEAIEKIKKLRNLIMLKGCDGAIVIVALPNKLLAHIFGVSQVVEYGGEI